MKKKRVIIINQFFPPDFAAAGQLLKELTTELSKKNLNIEILTGQPSYASNIRKTNKFELKKNITIRRTIASKIWPKRVRGKAINGFLFCLRTSLRIIFKSRKENLIIYTSCPPYLPIFGYLINKFLKIPYLVLIYDVYPEVLINLNIFNKNHWLIKLWKSFNNKVFSNASEIIVLSEEMKKTIRKYDFTNKNKIKIIPSWSDTDKFHPRNKINNLFSKKYKLEKKFTIIYSGNQGRCHDIYTIMVTALLLKKEKEISFVFIGNGFQNARIKEMKQEWQLDNCLVLPYQELNLLPFSLAAADLAFVTIKKGSDKAVAPSKLYGHLASGTPVAAISPENSYLQKIIEKENCGKWFKNGDAENIAKWIIEMKNSPKMISLLGDNGRKYILENASLKLISERYYKLISKYI